MRKEEGREGGRGVGRGGVSGRGRDQLTHCS